METKGSLTPALIAGVVGGVLSGIPGLSLGNCLLCGWLWGAGILAVYLYKRNDPMGVNSSQGLKLGLVAGLVAGIIMGLLSAVIGGGTFAQLANNPQFANNEQARAIVQMLANGGGAILSIILSLIFGALFGSIGGAIGAAIFKPKVA